jgi:hypothetical protein
MRLVGALLVASVLLMALEATPVLGANMRSLQAAATATVEGEVALASVVAAHVAQFYLVAPFNTWICPAFLSVGHDTARATCQRSPTVRLLSACR